MAKWDPVITIVRRVYWKYKEQYTYLILLLLYDKQFSNIAIHTVMIPIHIFGQDVT